jgi:hypothetical protein
LSSTDWGSDHWAKTGPTTTRRPAAASGSERPIVDLRRRGKAEVTSGGSQSKKTSRGDAPALRTDWRRTFGSPVVRSRGTLLGLLEDASALAQADVGIAMGTCS